jgi:Leucine-rich repeat (LRR) protein
LVIIDSDMEDLSSIAHLTALRELHLAGCDFLTDITALSEFSSLEALTLSLCEDVSDLSVLKGLRNLTRLGLPTDITQEEFAAVIGDHPGLRQIELVGCKNVNDLSPLKGLPELEHLVLIDTEASYAPLHEMKSLRFLMLPVELFEKSPEEVRKLEEALPQCTVAAGEVCLGSGWILMLLPAMALAWLLSRRRRAGPAQAGPRDG